jgi:hypothetical protein
MAGAGGQAGYSKRPRLDKLGVRPGMRVGLVGFDEPEFLAELAQRVTAPVRGRIPKGTDLAFVYLDGKAALPQLSKARRAIAPNGAVWALWPKGRKELREDDIRAFGSSAGLVDVKVIVFSPALSGLKLVIPVAQRTR